jgi:hypothetical protein
MEGLPTSTWIHESLWGFPIVVGTHILGLIVSVGILVWFDFRLMGFGLRHYPVSALYRRLIPWASGGFAVMFTSGGLLFAAYATSAYPNVYFRVKMAALLLAGINAAIYHVVTERDIANWDASPQPPVSARMAGLASIVLWAVVIVSGRMMSYTIF